MKRPDREDRMHCLQLAFCVMAAVAPRTILCGNERLYPAGSFVGAAAAPSRSDVICHFGRQRHRSKKNTKRN